MPHQTLCALMQPEAFSKYLSLYGEDEAREFPLSLLPEHPYDLGLVIPLRGEDPAEIKKRIEQLDTLVGNLRKKLILIAVVNNTLHSKPEYQEAHRKLMAYLHSLTGHWTGIFRAQIVSPYLTVLWVDRATQRPFQEKQGVGLARKMGCDLLIRLLSEKKLLTPWLWTTDADATLPLDFFDLPIHSNLAALHSSYRHALTDFSGSEALTLYEIHLRYYFLGLVWAGSPFAYPTIGSCLCLNAKAYSQVRGFQDREAGEDFHLLNKLRKVGKVFYRKGNPIVLRGRFSERVPFGTGKSTLSIYEILQKKEPFKLHSPGAFHFLKTFLLKITDAFLLSSSLGRERVHAYLNKLLEEDPLCHQVLGTLSVQKIIEDVFSTRNTPQSRIRHFHTSFDALKTLRLIHLYDDLHHSRLDWEQALACAPFCEGFLKEQDSERALFHLQKLEERWLGGTFIDLPFF